MPKMLFESVNPYDKNAIQYPIRHFNGKRYILHGLYTLNANDILLNYVLESIAKQKKLFRENNIKYRIVWRKNQMWFYVEG